MPGSRTKDLTNIKFGFSTVVELSEPGGSGKPAIWKCKCQCGATHYKRSVYINATIKGKPKHHGSCSPKCAQDLLKRQEIQSNMSELRILANDLEDKWGIKIEVGTLRQAQDSGWDYYLTGDKCTNGHIDAKATNRRQCLQCRADEARSEKAKARSSQYRERNPNASSEYYKRTNYYEENAEKIRARSKTWGKENRERANQTQRATRATPEGRLIHNLRNRVNKIMKRINTTKDETTLELLGCDAITVKEYIENQFTQGMSWENYGDWDVDHKRPCASYDLKITSEREAAFHFTNLQPLWSTPEKAAKHGIKISYEETNISKGSLFEGERHQFKSPREDKDTDLQQ